MTLFTTDYSAVVMPSAVLVAKVSVAMEMDSQDASVNLFTYLPSLPVTLTVSNGNSEQTIASVEKERYLTTNSSDDNLADQCSNLDLDGDLSGDLPCVIGCNYGNGKLCLCSPNIEVTYGDIGNHFPDYSGVLDQLQKTVYLRDCLFQYMMQVCDLH